MKKAVVIFLVFLHLFILFGEFEAAVIRKQAGTEGDHAIKVILLSNSDNKICLRY